jgi:hydroxymethylpyrimidine/phosphomethylpyrimidine kinase
VAEGKRFITEALRAGADVAIGQGYGPVNHGFNPLKMLTYEAR